MSRLFFWSLKRWKMYVPVYQLSVDLLCFALPENNFHQSTRVKTHIMFGLWYFFPPLLCRSLRIFNFPPVSLQPALCWQASLISQCWPKVCQVFLWPENMSSRCPEARFQRVGKLDSENKPPLQDRDQLHPTKGNYCLVSSFDIKHTCSNLT